MVSPQSCDVGNDSGKVTLDFIANFIAEKVEFIPESRRSRERLVGLTAAIRQPAKGDKHLGRLYGGRPEAAGSGGGEGFGDGGRAAAAAAVVGRWRSVEVGGSRLVEIY
ncbi:hypothetical protein SPI_04117 [Niveomyces insectorum RCEF 264]|uniref:Uncharacterized protein n=1 Tax=Niveomyces insectorum RCEF 264 TaxID=1081102 RepID=A0A167VG49_9HYPO|nr:hypothetical protein SPI_04117 [Niveomyces insectorum RCEF 264]